MNSFEYSNYQTLNKVLNKKNLTCASAGVQSNYFGHASKNKNITFRVTQQRKTHVEEFKDKKVSYLLFYKRELMMRVDLNGIDHKDIPTPHIHMFYDGKKHTKPLQNINGYDLTDDLIESFYEFLKYNHFKIDDINISMPLI